MGTGRRRLLVDTGEGGGRAVAYAEAVAGALAAEECELERVLLTHHHHDHIGGVAALRDRLGPVPVSMFEVEPGWVAAEAAARRGGKLGGMYVEELQWFERNAWDRIADGDTFEVQGASLRARHTPGHSVDHVVFEHLEERACFSGDNVLGWGTTWVQDLHAYMASLRAMAALRPRRLFPGHGPMVENGPAVIARYLRHREDREFQVLQTLAALTSKAEQPGVGVGDIAARLYPGAAGVALSAASSNVARVMAKLAKDGRVVGEMPPGQVPHQAERDPAIPEYVFQFRWREAPATVSLL